MNSFFRLDSIMGNGIGIIIAFFLSLAGDMLYAGPELYVEARRVLTPDVRESVLELSDQDQARVQKYFEKIYKNVQIPIDPQYCPTVILVNVNDARAFVIAGNRNYIFWSSNFFVNSPSEDIDAKVMSHELTHFEPQQDSRRQHMDGELLNEADADVRGVPKRILRIGLYTATGEPQAAVYSMNAIIAYARQDTAKSKTHLKGHEYSTIWQGHYLEERGRRHIPERPTPRKIDRATLSRVASMEKQIVSSSVAPKEFADSKTEQRIATVVDNVLSQQNGLAELRKQLARLKGNLTGTDVYNFGSAVDMLSKESRSNKNLFPDIFNGILIDADETLKRLLATWPQLTQSSDVIETYRRAGDYFACVISCKKHDAERIRENAKFITSRGDSITGLLKMASAYYETQLLKAVDRIPLLVLPLIHIISSGHDLEAEKIRHKCSEAVSRLRGEELYDAISEGSISTNAILRVGEEKKPLSDKAVRYLTANLSDPKYLEFKLIIAENASPDLLDELESRTSLTNVLTLFKRLTKLLDNDRIDRILYSKIEKIRAEFAVINRQYSHHALLIWSTEREKLKQRREMLSTNAETALYKLKRYETISGILVTAGTQINPLGIVQNSPTRNFGEQQTEHSAVLLEAAKDMNAKALWIIEYSKAKYYQNGEGPDIFKTKFPKTEAAVAEAISESPLVYIALLKNLRFGTDNIFDLFDWNSIISRMNIHQILSIFYTNTTYSPNEGSTLDPIVSAIYKKLTPMIAGGELSVPQILGTLQSIPAMTNMADPNGHDFFEAIRKALHLYSIEDRYTILNNIHPALFDDKRAYVEFVSDLLSPLFDTHTARNDMAARRTTLESIKQALSANTTIDQFLVQEIYDNLAAAIEARPEERELLRSDWKRQSEEVLEKSLRYIKVVLEAIEERRPDEKWEFLQWLRGKNKTLGEEITRSLYRTLKHNGIHIDYGTVTNYLRFRFENLEPMHRAAFFHYLLDNARHGLLTESVSSKTTYAKAVEEEILSGFSKNTRAVSSDVYHAALSALPETLKTYVTAIAFAESGKHSSPEQALHLTFSKLGPLFQKLEQNLAFEPSLPDSYRTEFKKSWDEAQEVKWFDTYDLLLRQYGDITAAGFRMVKIRNSGSTEIVVELEGPDGGRHIASVYREGVKASADTSAGDLRKMVSALIKVNESRYGFMELLAEDSIETLYLELQRQHKREMNDLMTEAYKRAAVALGGRVHNGSSIIEGWKVSSVKYSEHSLPEGKILITQNVAPGIPLKDLKKIDPEAYKTVTELVIRLDNQVLEDPEAPVDKDRMPGQVLVDPNTMEITLLDHGQARMVNAKSRELRNIFIGAALSNSDKSLRKILSDLGISNAQIRELRKQLGKTEMPLRPMTASNWIYKHNEMTDTQMHTFKDLFQQVKAKSRLGHWEKSDGMDISIIGSEWKTLALKNMTPVDSLVEACKILGRDAKAMFRKPFERPRN